MIVHSYNLNAGPEDPWPCYLRQPAYLVSLRPMTDMSQNQDGQYLGDGV